MDESLLKLLAGMRMLVQYHHCGGPRLIIGVYTIQALFSKRGR